MGDVTINANGYSQTKTEDRGWIGTHTLILEEKLGRKLLSGEKARFIDGDRTNLSQENVELVELSSYKSIEAKIAKLQAEVDDRLAMIKDLKSELSARAQTRS